MPTSDKGEHEGEHEGEHKEEHEAQTDGDNAVIFNAKGFDDICKHSNDGRHPTKQTPLWFIQQAREMTLFVFDNNLLRGGLQTATASPAFKKVLAEQIGGLQADGTYLAATFEAICMQAIHKELLLNRRKCSILDDLEVLTAQSQATNQVPDIQAGGSGGDTSGAATATCPKGECTQQQQQPNDGVASFKTYSQVDDAFQAAELARLSHKLFRVHVYQMDKWVKVWEVTRQYEIGQVHIGVALSRLRYYAAVDLFNFVVRSYRLVSELKKSIVAEQAADFQDNIAAQVTNLLIKYYGSLLSRERDMYSGERPTDPDGGDGFIVPGASSIIMPFVNQTAFACALDKLFVQLRSELGYNVDAFLGYLNRLQGFSKARKDRVDPLRVSISDTKDAARMTSDILAAMPRLLSELEDLMGDLVSAGRDKTESRRGVLIRLTEAFRSLPFDNPSLSQAYLYRIQEMTLDVAHPLLPLYFPVWDLRNKLRSDAPRFLRVGHVQKMIAGSAAVVAYSWGDMTVGILYVMKFVRFLIQVCALYVASKIFLEAYVSRVYANEKDPPPIVKLLFMFMGIDLTMQLILVTLLVLAVAPGGSLATVVNDNFMTQLLLDAIATSVMVMLLGLTLSAYVWRKTYFQYKKNGIGAVRSFVDMMVGVCAIMVIVPFFLLV